MYSRVVVNEGPTNHLYGSQGEKTNKKRCVYEIYVTISLARIEERQKGDERIVRPRP